MKSLKIKISMLKFAVFPLLILGVGCATDKESLDDGLFDNVSTNSREGDSVNIDNYGFEDDKDGWNGSFAISSDEYAGSSSAKLSSSSKSISQSVSVSRNTNYTLSAYILGGGTLGVTANGSDTERSGDYNNWTKVSVTFNSGSSTSVNIYGNYYDDEGRFDNFELIEGASSSSQRFEEMVGKTVRIENVSSGLWLRITGREDHDEVEVVNQSNTGNWPRWIVEELFEDGKYYYRFKNVESNRRFRPDTSSSGTDINVGKTSWTGVWTQWEVTSDGNGNYTFKNRSTSDYLNAGNNTDGAIAKATSSTNGNLTTWRIEDLSGNDANGETGGSNPSPTNPTGPISPGNAEIPSDLMSNCNQWKITYPTGDEDKTLCGEDNNEFWFVNDEGNGMVFRAPIRDDNGTTPNSSNIRSEFRERVADGSVDIYWTTDGRHAVYSKQAITHLPIVKDELVATQIHGDKSEGIDDSMVLRLEGSNLFLSFNGGKLRSNVAIKSNYSLGTVHEVIFEVVNGKHYCYYSEDGNLRAAYESGNASSYLVEDDGDAVLMDIDYGDAYFKIGNYTQSNADREGSRAGDPDNYGEVVVYDYFVRH